MIEELSNHDLFQDPGAVTMLLRADLELIE